MKVQSKATESLNDPKVMFGLLSQRFAKAKAEDQGRVLAHVRAVSGHNTLVAYHTNGASDEQKIALYDECLTAIINGDFSSLKGQLAGGQAQLSGKELEVALNAAHRVIKPKATAFVVMCKAKGEAEWSHNSIVLATAEEADQYGKDLYSRWMGLDKWEVHPFEGKVTAQWKDGALILLPDEKVEVKVEVSKTETVTNLMQAAKDAGKLEVVPVGAPTPTPPTPAPDPAPASDPLEAAIAQLTAAVAAKKAAPVVAAPSATMDEARIRQICREEFKDMVNQAVSAAIHTEKWALLKAMERETKTYRKTLADKVASAIESA